MILTTIEQIAQEYDKHARKAEARYLRTGSAFAAMARNVYEQKALALRKAMSTFKTSTKHHESDKYTLSGKYVAGVHICYQYNSNGTYYCTKPFNHEGAHVATFDWGGKGAPIETWPNKKKPAEAKLKEIVKFPYCHQQKKSWVCTLPKGHEGNHVAGHKYGNTKEEILEAGKIECEWPSNESTGQYPPW